MWVLPAPRTLEYRFGLAADRRNVRYWIVTGLAFTGRATSAFASAGLVRQRRGRVTELRVTIVVAVGLAAVALWLSAAWLLIVRVIR